ncbi:hypothetical protein [Burkholderia thailandensis]|uniref:hypothetical protein n=1 Tax=Burkholderia thailandensis TaxID=57975 RepID=UPI00016AA320|nr:hypothetical protein [Burkholderia thailandensis]AVR08619.1 hypothetical protein A8H31_13710 [Burkholderia thailandensis]AWY58651.1 hypothetical protein A8H35_09670 [Burkholderia thailandensis]AWY67183.1 hypothetical protein A8H36_18770 [Burkholderia thailandensis]NOK43141.1 hypothetical protein [Burkholderia thailandensis]NOK56877.1 hypothetical protein [Burkholderia thailandensis]
MNSSVERKAAPALPHEPSDACYGRHATATAGESQNPETAAAAVPASRRAAGAIRPASTLDTSEIAF